MLTPDLGMVHLPAPEAIRKQDKTGTFFKTQHLNTFDKMWSATTDGFSPPSVAQLDSCDGWPGAAGEPSEVVQPGKGRVRTLGAKPPMGW